MQISIEWFRLFKNMKKANSYILFLLFVVIGLASCGGDDDNSPSDVEQAIDIKEELKPFIGYWRIDGNGASTAYPDYGIWFYPDGKCYINYIWNGGSTGSASEWATWFYDDTRKYLSLTGISKAQWEIISVTNNAWSGIALWNSVGSNVYSAHKVTDARELFGHYINRYPKWVNGNDELVYEHSSLHSSYKYNFMKSNIEYQGHNPRSGEWLKRTVSFYFNDNCTYSIDGDTIICRYKAVDEKSMTYGTDLYLKIVHPYDYSNIYMQLQGVDQYGDRNIELSKDFFPVGN